MSKKTSIFNYAIVRSIFGDYWVGKTLLKADEKSIFSKIETAVNRAQDLYCEQHPCFDPNAEEEDEGYDDEAYCEWSNIESNAFDCEEIPVTIQDKIVRFR